jgi:CheY-like chemotaxis protein
MRINRRILIVDDEPYNILALQIILQKSGYPNVKDFIDSANNGQEAV